IAQSIGGKAPKLGMANSIMRAYGSINSFLAKMFGYKPAVTKELAAISCDNFYYSADKARKELQLPSTPMEVAFKECFQWYKDNGYLNKK
ncbi:MAG: hypothetical protein ACPG9L_05880, partial [Crocinitomicaceae bacterium]